MSGPSVRGANAWQLPRHVVFRTNGSPIILGGDTGCDVPYYRSRLSLLAAPLSPRARLHAATEVVRAIPKVVAAHHEA